MVDIVTASLLASSVFFVVLSFALLVRYKRISAQVSYSNDLGHDLWRALESRLKKQDERILDLMGRVEVIQTRLVQKQTESVGSQSVLGQGSSEVQSVSKGAALRQDVDSPSTVPLRIMSRQDSGFENSMGFMKSLDARMVEQDERLAVIASKLEAIRSHVSSTPSRMSLVSTVAKSVPSVLSHESIVKVNETELMKMLAEQPRTSVEVRECFGITREHAARVLKSLFDRQLVSRNDSHKPFVYELTELGRRALLAG
jgi:archaellum component FlaC